MDFYTYQLGLTTRTKTNKQGRADGWRIFSQRRHLHIWSHQHYPENGQRYYQVKALVTDHMPLKNVALMARISTECIQQSSVLKSEKSFSDKIENIWNLLNPGYIQRLNHPRKCLSSKLSMSTVIISIGSDFHGSLHTRHYDDNFSLCNRCTYATFSQLWESPDSLNHFIKLPQEQIKLHFIEKVDHAQHVEAMHFLSLLCVKKNSRKTPLCIVCDCSARTKSVISLC